MNAQDTPVIKNQEYDLLEAIAHDPLVTQAGLSAQLGIAVGGVNWYIKRLVNIGYIKVSHLDRTRLKYHLTPAGVSVLTQRTLGYMQKSLGVYKQLRSRAKLVVSELKAKGITQVYLDGNDEMMDILRLSCLEAGLTCIVEQKRNDGRPAEDGGPGTEDRLKTEDRGPMTGSLSPVLRPSPSPSPVPRPRSSLRPPSPVPDSPQGVVLKASGGDFKIVYLETQP